MRYSTRCSRRLAVSLFTCFLASGYTQVLHSGRAAIGAMALSPCKTKYVRQLGRRAWPALLSVPAEHACWRSITG